MGRARLRPPAESGTILADPALEEAHRLIAGNAQLLAAWRYDFQGRSSAQLRAMTRAGVLDASREYLTDTQPIGSLGHRASNPLERPLIVTGHQPELFHPGVWIKNFVGHWLARRCGGQALHLLIDNDIVKGTTVRVPTGSVAEPRVVQLPIDHPRGEKPFEEYQVEDEETFAAFGTRLTRAAGQLGIEPLAEQLWPVAIELGQRTSNLGERVSAARRRLEARWGCVNLEVPASRLCQSDGFYWFLCHLLAHLPRFQAEHNRALEAFRRRHRIRSRHHPVPALQSQGGWLEAPFWVWTTQSPHRRQLYARQEGQELLLTDREQWRARLPLEPDREACCAVEVLREQTSRGAKFRMRALTTTIFSRLCLADLFIHGLGGARYDELSDELIERFYQLDPPRFLTLTTTLHLPIPPHDTTAEGAREQERRIRDLRYNPQRHLKIPLGANTELSALVENRWELVRMQPSSRTERRNRFERIRQLNQLLAPAVEPARIEAVRRLDDLRARLRANAILQNRDWAFCVYPEETLHALYRPFLEDNAVR